ncbi:hypothetical protein [Phyllobacterium phragmitis]|nr:hypothetical protein [Phyllobacterium phragmitis]
MNSTVNNDKVAIVSGASRGIGASPDGGWIDGQVLRANDGMI